MGDNGVGKDERRTRSTQEERGERRAGGAGEDKEGGGVDTCVRRGVLPGTADVSNPGPPRPQPQQARPSDRCQQDPGPLLPRRQTAVKFSTAIGKFRLSLNVYRRRGPVAMATPLSLLSTRLVAMATLIVPHLRGPIMSDLPIVSTCSRASLMTVEALDYAPVAPRPAIRNSFRLVEFKGRR